LGRFFIQFNKTITELVCTNQPQNGMILVAR
jgi:hypothetical protein